MADLIKVASIPGLEPEEQPVAREVDSTIEVRGSVTGASLGSMGSQVQMITSAGEFAENLRRVCANCKHFDNARAVKLFIESENTAEGRKELNTLKWNLAVMQAAPEGTDGQPDMDAALVSMGVCGAISEITKSDVIVHPLGFCPVETYGDNFKPADRAARLRGEAGRDDILLRAEGKKP